MRVNGFTIIRKKISVWVEWLHLSESTLSEPSETVWWRLTLRLGSKQSIALNIALWSQFYCFFSLCCTPISKEQFGVVANCDHTSELVHWVRTSTGIVMWWVMLRKLLLEFLLSLGKMQFSLYWLYRSFQVTRCMWLLTINCSFGSSSALLLAAIAAITCMQLIMLPTLKTCRAMAASSFLTGTNFKTGSKLPKFSGSVVSASANHYSTKDPSLFRSFMLNSRCSCHANRPLSTPQHLPGRCLPTHSRSVGPLHVSSGFLCITTCEICIHLRKSQLQLWYNGKCRVPLRAVIHLICISCSDSYGGKSPMCRCILSHGVLRLAYCRVVLWSLWSLRQVAFHHGGFEDWWNWGSDMTGSSGGSQISTGREDIAGGSAVLLTLSVCWEIKLSDFELENMTRNGDYLQLVVEILIGGVPTGLQVCFMCMFMSLSRMMLPCFISTNLFDPM